jgi:hypothetical protein
MINRKKFFDAIRQDPFDGVLSQPQVDGVNDILDVYEAKYSGLLLTQLAYVFATDFTRQRTRCSQSRNRVKAKAIPMVSLIL